MGLDYKTADQTSNSESFREQAPDVETAAEAEIETAVSDRGYRSQSSARGLLISVVCRSTNSTDAKQLFPEAVPEKPQRTSTKTVDSQFAVDEIKAYIAIRDSWLAEAEATTTSANLHRVILANDFVQSCLKPSRSPYKAQYLPERDADRERKRCAAVKIRIAELDTQIAL